MKKLQSILLCLIALTVAHTYRRIIWLAADQPDLFPEFQGVVVFLSDLVMAAFVFVSGVRLLSEADYQARIKKALSLIVHDLGGKWWIAFLIWMWCSLLWSKVPLLAAYDSLHLTVTLILTLLIAVTLHEENEQHFVLALAIGAIGQSILAVLQTVKGGPVGLTALGEIRWIPPVGVITGWEQTGLYRGNGLTVNPNNLAGYLLIGLVSCLFFISRDRNNQRQLLAIGVVLICCGLLSTMSRSVLAGVVVAALPMLFSSIRRLPVSRVASSGLLIIGIASIIVLVLVFGNQIADRVLNIQDDLRDRQILFAQTNAVIQQNPILGTGAHNLMLIISENRLRENPYSALVPAVPVHNVYWLILALLGLPGLMFFSAGCISVIGFTYGHLWTYAFLAICVIMLFDYYFWGDNRSRILIYIVIGLSWGTKLRDFVPKQDK